MENTKHFVFDVLGDIDALKLGKLSSKRFINDSFRSAYPVEYDWLLRNYGSFTFARSVYRYLNKTGRLTHKQLKAIQNFAFRE